jgi:hypothetical protein
MSGQRGALVAAALVALALVLPMAQQAVPAASRSSAPSAVRLPSPAERAAIVAALREDWTSAPYQELESLPWNSGPLPRHINYSSLHLAVSKVVVARSGPLLAEAAAAPVNARGVPVLPPGIVLLNTFARGASWELLYGAMTVFPNACSGATPADFRELLCPSPWRVLGLRPPLLPHLVEPVAKVGRDGLHGVNWSDVTVPGVVCGSSSAVHLRRGSAWVVSLTYPWWDFLMVNTSPPAYGRLSGVPVAVLATECDNGAGTADGQLAFSAVVYSTSKDRLRVVGIITPRQPFGLMSHAPRLGRFSFKDGTIEAQEWWYAPGRGACCPDRVATTVWRYANGSLDPVRTTVKGYPTTTP